MYKRIISTAICVIALITVSLLSAYATEPTGTATEHPTEQITEAASELATEQQSDDHNAICALCFAIGIPAGCMLAQGFSFWKW